MLHVIRSGKLNIVFDSESLSLYSVSPGVADILDPHANFGGYEKSGWNANASAIKEYKEGNKATIDELSRLVLVVAQTCNMKCKYCYAQSYMSKASAPFIMSVGTALKTAETFLKLYPDRLKNIQFTGGEPLIGFPVIKEVVLFTREYCQARQISTPHFNIVTNGTLLTPEIVDFLQEQRFQITVSLDGPREINDQQRIFPSGRGTHDIVTSKIQELERRGIDVTIEATFTRKHIEQGASVQSILEYTKSIGAKGLHISPVIGNYGGDELIMTAQDIEYIVQSYKIATFAIFDSFLTGTPDRVDYVLYILGALTGKGYTHFCDAGIKALTVDTEGNIYPCFVLIGEDFLMGNINSEEFPSAKFFEMRAMFENMGKERLEPCKTCWAKKLCSACFGDAYSKSQSLGAPSDQICKVTRAMVEAALLKVSQFRMDMNLWSKFLEAVATLATPDWQSVCNDS
jgi:uncharacterized protein